MFIGPVASIHQPQHSLNHRSRNKRTRLRAIPIERYWFTPQSLDDEVAYNTSTVGQHTRPISVENPHDAHLDTTHSLVVEAEGLGDALALVITVECRSGSHIRGNLLLGMYLDRHKPHWC